MRSVFHVIIAGLSILLAAEGAAARTFSELFPNTKYKNEEAQRIVESFNYQQGQVEIPDIGVKLQVPPKFYYLAPVDARRVITEIWGNPASTAQATRGMILPADKTPVDDTWGAIISYEADGYVSDADAEKIDYTELLSGMQSATSEANEERTKAGFPTIKLVGWAARPYYDKAAHKLHWAKELEFGGNPKHTLNYDVRALGRHGVLKMNFVAGMGDLDQIRAVIPAVMAMPEYEQGSRYEDFVPSTDKVAAYGIGGLIAGKAAAKLGLLAVALAFLKKGWILLFLAFGGAFSWLKRLFTGSKSPPPPPPAS